MHKNESDVSLLRKQEICLRHRLESAFASDNMEEAVELNRCLHELYGALYSLGSPQKDECEGAAEAK